MPSLPSAQSLDISIKSINAHFTKEDQKHFPRNWDAQLVLRHRNPGQHDESQLCNDQANKLRALFRRRAADKTASFTVGESPQPKVTLVLWKSSTLTNSLALALSAQVPPTPSWPTQWARPASVRPFSALLGLIQRSLTESYAPPETLYLSGAVSSLTDVPTFEPSADLVGLSSGGFVMTLTLLLLLISSSLLPGRLHL